MVIGPSDPLALMSAVGIALKVAVQDLLAFIVTAPSEQSLSPDQPVKVEPDAAEAVKVTEVPEV